METFLDNIRRKEKSSTMGRYITSTMAILLVGIALGTLSKYLDCIASNELPSILEYLDVRNFLGRFAIWLLLALCIAVYSHSAVRAAINVFAFFAGMVASYYLYSNYVAGFFPKSYALIWLGFTAVSPFLAFICWYAKGKGEISLGISAVIIAILFNASFAFGWLYFNMHSILELITFLCGVVVLKRKSAKDTVIMIVIGIAAAFLIHLVVPFHFG